MAFCTGSWALATAPETAVSTLCLPQAAPTASRTPPPGEETEAQRGETGRHRGTHSSRGPKVPQMLGASLSGQLEAKQEPPASAPASPAPWPAGASEAWGLDPLGLWLANRGLQATCGSLAP